jgi:hypothetical protein
MIHWLLAMALGFSTQGIAGPKPNHRGACQPAYMVLEEPVKVQVGGSELSFKLLAVGCEDALTTTWPPKREELEQELAKELREPHPVQILFLIRDRSPDLRRQVTRSLNKVLGKEIVRDVFLYSPRVAE